MAYARRRRPARKFAGKKAGRRFFWYRFTPFGLDLEQASTATHSAILISEAEWQDPILNLNEQVRGGARLERLICDFGLAVEGNDTFWRAVGDANIDLIPEFMVWQQSDQFASIVTSSTSFDATRQDARVIMDTIPMETGAMNFRGTTANSVRWCRGRYETKSKVRLGDKSLGVAWRGLFDTGSVNLSGYTDWFRPTLLISLP